MREIKKLDFKEKSFIANGIKYTWDGSLTLARWQEFEKLQPRLGFGKDFETILKNINLSIDLVPNSNKRSIIYFENNGIKISPINGNIFECVANVRLVCWCNLKKINDTFVNADLIKLAVIQAMPVSLSNVFPYSFIRIELTGEETKNVSIFSKYTYNEEEKQYLIFPFDYFALNYEVSFYVGSNCIEPITISPSIC